MSATWSPLVEVETVRNRLDRLFHQLWPAPSSALVPLVEVYTTADRQEVVVQVELPGIAIEDVTVELGEDVVHLSGELRPAEPVREEDYYRAERQYGRFDRTIRLPAKVRGEAARARYHDGVLSIRAPLAEETRRPAARKLAVEA